MVDLCFKLGIVVIYSFLDNLIYKLVKPIVFFLILT